MTLRSKVIRLAHARPDLRPALLPLLKRASQGWVDVKRGDYMDQVWSMYEATYRQIGLSKANPSEMMTDYDVWQVFMKDETPIAFSLAKKTPFGVKTGLLGSDGSPEGKSAVKDYLRTNFKTSGHYGEVSHGVEKIVLAASPPVVCAVYADDVLKKPIAPEPDGLRYTRSLSGVGNVTKILVGKPKGVPTTSLNNPSCPAGPPPEVKLATDDGDDVCDLDAHLACQIEW